MLLNYEKNNHTIARDTIELMHIWMQEHIAHYDTQLANAISASRGYRPILSGEYQAGREDQLPCHRMNIAEASPG